MKRILSFGEILWDLLPGGNAVLGGAPFNFAYRMHTLGHESYMVSRLGRDAYGERAARQMENLGMEMQCLQWDDQHPTGTVRVFLDEHSQPDFTIFPNVAYDFVELTEDLIRLAAQVDCIGFGTLAQRHPTSHGTLDKLLKTNERALKVLDLNLRKECYTAESVRMSLYQGDVLKLNDYEAQVLREMFSLPHENLVELAFALIDQFPLSLCLITLGEQGVAAVTRKGERVYVPGYRIRLIDPVGSGDAFTAAFLHGYFNNQSLAECCRYGNALGALVATTPGATAPFSIPDIQAFIDSQPERIRNRTFDEIAVD
jgi:fructokinase